MLTVNLFVYLIVLLLMAPGGKSVLTIDKTSCQFDLESISEAVAEMQSMANAVSTMLVRASSTQTQMAPLEQKVLYYTFDSYFTLRGMGVNNRVQDVLSMFKDRRTPARLIADLQI
jgi:hypothetical protein